MIVFDYEIYSRIVVHDERDAVPGIEHTIRTDKFCENLCLSLAFQLLVLLFVVFK